MRHFPEALPLFRLKPCSTASTGLVLHPAANASRVWEIRCIGTLAIPTLIWNLATLLGLPIWLAVPMILLLLVPVCLLSMKLGSVLGTGLLRLLKLPNEAPFWPWWTTRFHLLAIGMTMACLNPPKPLLIAWVVFVGLNLLAWPVVLLRKPTAEPQSS